MQKKSANKRLKTAGCAVLIAASLLSVPCYAVRVQPIAQDGVVNQMYGTDEREMQLYRAVSQAVSEGKKTLDYTFKTPIKDKDTFIELCRQAVYQVRRDYPESFLDNHTDFMYYYDQNGYNRVVFEFGYLNLSSKQKQELLDEVDRIVAQGKEKTSNTVELLQYFQETLRAKNEYDMQAAKSDSDHYPTAFHAYGALIEGKSVCQGYAYAFKMLCDKAQIPCWIVTGYYREPHAWNYVWLDGEYYQVDVTWDDTNNRASDSPYFLAGQDYAKDYVVEDNSAPGVLAEHSYFEQNKTQIQKKDTAGQEKGSSRSKSLSSSARA